MNADNDAAQDAPIFAALIRPHRSLDRTGFIIVMTLICGISFITGVVFFMVGAWPVLGFLGLDVLLVYWAFHINYRAAAAYEQVTVTASELVVRQVSHHGSVRQWTFNPVWARLDRVTHAEFGLERLFVVSHGKKLAIAGLLGPAEKEDFAQALAAALAQARRGPTQTVVT
jgi:uncharacterized membrane protein